jgi:hypothetical protein
MFISSSSHALCIPCSLVGLYTTALGKTRAAYRENASILSPISPESSGPSLSSFNTVLKQNLNFNLPERPPDESIHLSSNTVFKQNLNLPERPNESISLELLPVTAAR